MNIDDLLYGARFKLGCVVTEVDNISTPDPLNTNFSDDAIKFMTRRIEFRRELDPLLSPLMKAIPESKLGEVRSREAYRLIHGILSTYEEMNFQGYFGHQAIIRHLAAMRETLTPEVERSYRDFLLILNREAKANVTSIIRLIEIFTTPPPPPLPSYRLDAII